MTGLTLEPILRQAGIDLADAHVIHHAYVEEHEDSGLRGMHADSTGSFGRGTSPCTRCVSLIRSATCRHVCAS